MAYKNNNIPLPPSLKSDHQKQLKEGALKLHRMGFAVIPLLPDQKRPPCKWEQWENYQSEQKIIEHWTAHPEHEVGFITDENLIIFDADTKESLEALYFLEKTFEVEPLIKVKTKKGEHHYFRRPDEVMARQGGFSSEANPERIDVKTGRSLVVAPPSGNKEFLFCDVVHADQLVEVTQDFVDAVNKHNGRNQQLTDSVKSPGPITCCRHIRNYSDKEIAEYLKYVPADSDYQDWTHVGMALHHEYQGSDAGLTLFDRWSSDGSKYPGTADIANKWQSFSGYDGQPITIATLKKLAAEHGANVNKITIDCNYEIFETVVMSTADTSSTYPTPKSPAIRKPVPTTAEPQVNPLERFAINDQLENLKKEARDAVYVMDNIVLKSQLTNFYAKPNTGKTLISLKLIVDQVKAGVVEGKSVYFINADDNFNGLTEKLELLLPHGIKVLAPGLKGFKSGDMRAILSDITARNLAKESIILFDTLKKFTDVMSKFVSSEFWRDLRSFSSAGGTVISLAHTNKNDGADGKPIYAGTTDSLDDADCAYTLARRDDGEQDYAIVEFTNIKNRGNVRQKAYFSYSLKEGQSYTELFNSVEEVAPEDVQSLLTTTEKNTFDESAVRDAIKDCIAEGTNKKMELVKAAAALTDISQRKVLGILETYTGDNPQIHQWNFKVGERGAKVYSILPPLSNPTTTATGEDDSHGSADF